MVHMEGVCLKVGVKGMLEGGGEGNGKREGEGNGKGEGSSSSSMI